MVNRSMLYSTLRDWQDDGPLDVESWLVDDPISGNLEFIANDRAGREQAWDLFAPLIMTIDLVKLDADVSSYIADGLAAVRLKRERQQVKFEAFKYVADACSRVAVVKDGEFYISRCGVQPWEKAEWLCDGRVESIKFDERRARRWRSAELALEACFPSVFDCETSRRLTDRLLSVLQRPVELSDRSSAARC